MLNLFVDKKEEKLKSRRTAAFSEKSLFPILRADKLLASIKHEKLLAEIKELVGISDKNYQTLYGKLLNNFAEFVQILPTTNQSHLGSLLEEGLRRALFILEEQRAEQIGLTQPEIYMLFSVGLLFDMARVIEGRSVLLSERNGAFIEKWLPSFAGNMLDQAKYYRIRIGGGYASQLCRRITPALAEQLLPKRGLKLIARDAQLYAKWWALLSDDYREADGYRRTLSRALEKLNDFIEMQGFDLPVDVEALDSDLELGDEFVEWLQDALANGEFDVNNPRSDVQVIDGRIVLKTPGAFKDFADTKQVDWQAVYKEFEDLGFAAITEEDQKVEQAIQKEMTSQDYYKGQRESAATLFTKQAVTTEVLDTDTKAKLATTETSTHLKNFVVLPDDASAMLSARGISLPGVTHAATPSSAA
jgi:hypothetical protein